MGAAAADAPVYKAAVSIGWNPTYTGEQAVRHKMIEPYILHEFAEDFYGEPLRYVWLRSCSFLGPSFARC